MVKCNPAGAPVEPFECAGLAAPDAVEGTVSTLRTPLQLDRQYAGDTPELTVVPRSSTAPEPAHVARLQHHAAPASSDVAMDVVAQVAQMHSWIREMGPDKGKWLEDLPKVRVKASYLGCEPPQPKSDSRGRAT